MTAADRPSHLSEIVGHRGVFGTLSKVVNSQPLPRDEVRNFLIEQGIAAPDEVFSALVAAGVLGESSDRFFLSSFGQKIWLLLSAINGADLNSVVDQLTKAHPRSRSYELVTEGMTFDFIN